jgi:hypothetical protein
MNARSRGIIPAAQGIVDEKRHFDRDCDCDACRMVFRSGSTLKTVPAVGSGPLPDRSGTAVEIAQKTIMAMHNAGVNFHQEISGILPSGHRMQEAIRARVLPNHPFLGHCRIGRVPISKNGNRYTWAEFHLTNFAAKLDTRINRQFYSGQSLQDAVKAGSLFYGVAVITDKQGNTLDFNREVGDMGVCFETRDKAHAAYAMAGISTGMSLAQLKELDRKNFIGFKNSSG